MSHHLGGHLIEGTGADPGVGRSGFRGEMRRVRRVVLLGAFGGFSRTAKRAACEERQRHERPNDDHIGRNVPSSAVVPELRRFTDGDVLAEEETASAGSNWPESLPRPVLPPMRAAQPQLASRHL